MHEEAAAGRLAEYVESLRGPIDLIPNPVYVSDLETNIVAFNRAFTEAFEDPDSSCTKCHELLHCSDAPEEDCISRKVMRNMRTETMEFTTPYFNCRLLVTASPIMHDGTILGVIHSATDISEIKAGKDYRDNYQEMISIYAGTIKDLRARERSLQKSKDAFFNMLEDISESYRELQALFLSLMRALVNALDAKSPWTRGHSERVFKYVEQIAIEMGLDEDERKNLYLASMLHDIGKIGTHDALLNKPETLTSEEFDIIKQHPSKAEEILAEVRQLEDVTPIIKHHHERFDGKGYPDGLKEEEIPLCSRILTVADAFDSMMVDRPYRQAPGLEYAVSELRHYSGTQFDPRVVEALLRVIEKSPAISVMSTPADRGR